MVRPTRASRWDEVPLRHELGGYLLLVPETPHEAFEPLVELVNALPSTVMEWRSAVWRSDRSAGNVEVWCAGVAELILAVRSLGETFRHGLSVVAPPIRPGSPIWSRYVEFYERAEAGVFRMESTYGMHRPDGGASELIIIDGSYALELCGMLDTSEDAKGK
jgi:hypothetical protein